MWVSIEKKENEIRYKESLKLKKKISDKKYSLEIKYGKMIDLRKEKLEIRKMKELEKYISKVSKKSEKDINSKIRKLKWHKKPWKQKKEGENKGLTLVQIERSVTATMHLTIKSLQRYAVLARMDRNNKWQCMCCWKWRDWKKLNWWHVWPKQRYINVAFELNNIMPLCWNCNRQQWNNFARSRESNWKKFIWNNEYNRICKLAQKYRSFSKADMYEYREFRDQKLDYEMRQRGLK